MTYKFEVTESYKVGILQLKVFVREDDRRDNPGWVCTDIIEGPYVFVVNKLIAYYDDVRRLRKVK